MTGPEDYQGLGPKVVMKEALGAGRWKIRLSLMSKPFLEVGTSWQAEGMEEMEE